MARKKHKPRWNTSQASIPSELAQEIADQVILVRLGTAWKCVKSVDDPKTAKYHFSYEVPNLTMDPNGAYVTVDYFDRNQVEFYLALI
ncbi:MAG: hypothetical protein ACI8RZ_005131 [Myxococcota bacterium]|jgi:hypothetical protein